MCHNKKDKCGEITVDEYSLPPNAKRRWGKLLNILDCSEASRTIYQKFSVELLWLYNRYAAKITRATLIYQKIRVPVVFEFED